MVFFCWFGLGLGLVWPGVVWCLGLDQYGFPWVWIWMGGLFGMLPSVSVVCMGGVPQRTVLFLVWARECHCIRHARLDG
ncbi:hypothetical protein QBC39DRAFT_359156 [Podospora conica]|nr:hypothetical protein QBC39DRAFT_359156 [Schizothecium conicum]